MEKRLETVLRKVLGSEDVFVVANAELLADSDRPEVEVLPGVVVKTTPSTPAPLELPASLVKRINISIFVGRKTSDTNVELARKTAERMVGLKPERGDVLTVEKVGAAAEAAEAMAAPTVSRLNILAEKFLNPDPILLLTYLVSAFLALFWFIRRFLDPLLIVLRDAAQNIQRAIADRAAAPDAAAEQTPAAAAAAAPIEVAAPATSKEDDRKVPFSFIKERDIAALNLLLLEQSERASAVIVQYLPPALVSKALAAMTEIKREKVVACMSQAALLDTGDVKKLEDLIRSRIDYMMGGEEKLIAIIEQASITMQTSILASVRLSDPELGRRLERRITLLSDMGLLDEAGLAILSRQASVRSMAVVLKFSPALREKVLPKFKTGLGEWLAQETTMIGELPEHIKDQEMKGVLQALIKLVREGKIVIKKDAPPVPMPSPSAPAPMPQVPTSNGSTAKVAAKGGS